MGNCTPSSPEQATVKAKACSGKCLKGGCKPRANVWIVAACDGMMSLLEKQADGHLTLIPQGESLVSSSIDSFREYLSHATETSSYTQLVMIGAPNDISWMRAALPDNAAKYIVAEIKYPLLPQWFRQPPLKSLTQALEQIFLV